MYIIKYKLPVSNVSHPYVLSISAASSLDQKRTSLPKVNHILYRESTSFVRMFKQQLMKPNDEMNCLCAYCSVHQNRIIQKLTPASDAMIFDQSTIIHQFVAFINSKVANLDAKSNYEHTSMACLYIFHLTQYEMAFFFQDIRNRILNFLMCPGLY